MDAATVELDEQRRAHLYGDWGPLWVGAPSARFGTCPVCLKGRAPRRQVIEGHITWDAVCTSRDCTVGSPQ